MAGIDVGGGGGKRPTNHEIPLIPFIDFLLCLVAFLLVTAVWSQMARINADARVPVPPAGRADGEAEERKAASRRDARRAEVSTRLEAGQHRGEHHRR